MMDYLAEVGNKNLFGSTPIFNTRYISNKTTYMITIMRVIIIVEGITGAVKIYEPQDMTVAVDWVMGFSAEKATAI